MSSNFDEYYQQLQFINQMLENTREGTEYEELISLKQNIEELLSLTDTGGDDPAGGSSDNNTISLDKEYALFMAEINSEESNEEIVDKINLSEKYKHLEGKKFRAPHTYAWGQTAYHSCMVCCIPDNILKEGEFEVKVLFLNPTHTEMRPCPYYFNYKTNCNYSEGQCKFSHGEYVHYSTLQEYIEPNFEECSIGSEVIAKNSDELWYRGKIVQFSDQNCLVRFDHDKSYKEIFFKDIVPLDNPKSNSDVESGSDSDCQLVGDDNDDIMKKQQQNEALINQSLMITPDSQRLGDWEKHTKGIGSKLMQRMGYIVGTGLGKEGKGIIKPVSAVILPQGKSLDYCMKLKEESNNPQMFHAENLKTSVKDRPKRRSAKKAAKMMKVEQMELDKFLKWYFHHGTIPAGEKENNLLRDKLKAAQDKDVNVAKFMIDERYKNVMKQVTELKDSIKRLEEMHQDTKSLSRKLSYRENDINRLNKFVLLVQNELDRRKNNKEMAVF